MAPESHISRLRRLSGIKWARCAEDVLAAWVADMDFLTAPAVREALVRMAEDGDTGYGFEAHQRIPGAFADWTERHHGWRPEPERVRLFAGVLQPIAMALALATKPGDGVVLFTPIYPPFFDMIEKAGRRVIDCPLDADGWRIDLDLLERSVDDSTSAVILCQPHNPTGRVFTAEELAGVARIAEEHGLLVISDEIWCDITFPGHPHLPFVSVGGSAADRALTVTAASKTFNLGGLTCAVAHFADEELLAVADAMPPHLLGHVNSFGASATLAAWTEGEGWLAETLETLRTNRERLAERLAEELPAVGFGVPEATYLAWLDLRPLGLPSDPAKYLLEHAGVLLSPGPDFGAQGNGFARLNFATTPEILGEILDRIVTALR